VIAPVVQILEPVGEPLQPALEILERPNVPPADSALPSPEDVAPAEGMPGSGSEKDDSGHTADPPGVIQVEKPDLPDRPRAENELVSPTAPAEVTSLPEDATTTEPNTLWPTPAAGASQSSSEKPDPLPAKTSEAAGTAPTVSGREAPAAVLEVQGAVGVHGDASFEGSDEAWGISGWHPAPDINPPQAQSHNTQPSGLLLHTFPASPGQVSSSAAGGISLNAAFFSALPALGLSAFVMDVPSAESTPSSPTYIPFTPPRLLQP
jgi:hypothetical protein